MAMCSLNIYKCHAQSEKFTFFALIGYQSRASVGLFLHPLISLINDLLYC